LQLLNTYFLILSTCHHEALQIIALVVLLGLHSLESSRLGLCLAPGECFVVSVSISPTCRHLLLGLASSRALSVASRFKFGAMFNLNCIISLIDSGLLSYRGSIESHSDSACRPPGGADWIQSIHHLVIFSSQQTTGNSFLSMIQVSFLK
jgi:hypothetical protein